MRRHKVGARSRVLDDSELRAVWKQAGGGGTFGALIKMLLLTGQRRGAVLGMRWKLIQPMACGNPEWNARKAMPVR